MPDCPSHGRRPHIFPSIVLWRSMPEVKPPAASPALSAGLSASTDMVIGGGAAKTGLAERQTKRQVPRKEARILGAGQWNKGRFSAENVDFDIRKPLRTEFREQID